jgi:hypothetical protein
MTPFTSLCLGLLLGGGIGAQGMWLYLMQKHSGRPIHWRTIIETMAIVTTVLGILFGMH